MSIILLRIISIKICSISSSSTTTTNNNNNDNDNHDNDDTNTNTNTACAPRRYPQLVLLHAAPLPATAGNIIVDYSIV